MTHAPGIPPEPRSYAEKGGQAPEIIGDTERRDPDPEIQTGQPGDSEVNLDGQGWFGNLKQNLTNQWKVQDR